jgi:hypothetical protein
MKSWKARLLVVLTMLAMLLAVSLPTMADPLDSRSDPRFAGFDPRFAGSDPRFAGFDPRFADDGNGDSVVDEFSLGDLDCVVLGKERVDDSGRPFLKPKRLICVDPNGTVAVDRRV